MELRQLVESIVHQIVTMEKDAEKPAKVLYVFSDSTAHEAFTDHFILLKNHGITHDMLLLDGITSGWLGNHRIESGSPGKVIAVDESAPAPLELPIDYDGIIIPEIDMDSAGKASLGMKGTVISEIIFSARVLDKFVLIGEDVSGLSRADRRTLKTLKLPEPYTRLFAYYKKELAMYGVEFAPREQLAEQAVGKFGSARIIGSAVVETVEPSDHVQFEGRLISAEWVKQQLTNKAFSRLTVGKDAILSPLAKDMLKEKGIAVHYADEG
jgi:hypothetical protein